MFCNKCGAPIEDGSLFCGECGAPVRSSVVFAPPAGEYSPAPLPDDAARKRKLRNRIFLFGGIGLGVLALAAVLLIILLGARTPEDVARAYVDERLNTFTKGADVNRILELSYPESVIQYRIEESGYETRREFLSQLQRNSDRNTQHFKEESGDPDLHFTTEVVASRSVSKSQLRELMENALDDGFIITDARHVSVSVVIFVNGKYRPATVNVTAYQANGKWYAGNADGLSKIYNTVMDMARTTGR